MNNSVKDRIHELVDSIHDEKTLNQVMEDVTFYSSKKEVLDSLSVDQLSELEVAISEADNDQVINWTDFKKELNEWKKR
ncbi:MAG: hypothetical protein K2U26_02855 [Cyclobacteriaceae bacterium]|nr:hypothetical protein [Cyclobacteriaceae bacterium]